VPVLDIGSLVLGALTSGTVISYAALGQNLTELSGVYNVGTEGTMLLAAATSFMVSLITGSPTIGLLAGILLGATIGAILAVFAINIGADQIVFGLGLILVGTFMSTVIANTALSGRSSFSSISTFPPLDTEGFPSPLNLILKQNFLFYLVFVVAVALWYLLFKTKFGLAIRAAGENPHVAVSAGKNLILIRYFCTVLGSAVAALGGIFVIYLNGIWGDRLTGGRGFVAIAMVRVGLFRPHLVLLASLLFGFVDSIQLYFTAILGSSFPYQFFAMIPYVVGMLVLLVSTRFGIFKEPSGLGRPYAKESR
jgi:simple sugar transport system permease protein